VPRPFHAAASSSDADAAPVRHAAGLERARQWLGTSARLSETWWDRAAGPLAVGDAARARLDSLVRYARVRSPFYRHAYRHLPDSGIDLCALPVTTKRALMARFDDWVTDAAVRRADLDRFLADRTHARERYLDRYVVWKTSGTSGEPGIFLQDEDALEVYGALLGIQLTRPDIASRVAAGVFNRGGRAALIAATGDHFAAIGWWQRVCRGPVEPQARAFSLLAPRDQLIGELEAFDPAYLASYPTMLAILAGERAAGRLRIAPDLLWSGGEYLSPATQARIEAAFGCPVVNEYGSSECFSIAFGCAAGWLHVNADWVLLEPVDADHQRTPPGHVSHSVLVTNLANRIQPVIRYDLGDAVVARGEPCECGSPLPAIRVQGRRDDVLEFERPGTHSVHVPPMALTTVIEEAGGVHRFQVVRRAPDCLAVRLDPVEVRGRVDAVFARVSQALRAYLERQGIPAVRITRDRASPQRDARSGKLRQVVAVPTRAGSACNPVEHPPA
jgi:phenylacetate-coenzyme A ligase PaaK-like adenylate-forming protein